MSTPPALASALKTYEVAYARDFEKAAKKNEGKIWYDPTEAERKALVANQRKGRDLAYAPTGSALKAGRFLDIETAAAQNSQQALMSVAPSLAISPRGRMRHSLSPLHRSLSRPPRRLRPHLRWLRRQVPRRSRHPIRESKSRQQLRPRPRSRSGRSGKRGGCA